MLHLLNFDRDSKANTHKDDKVRTLCFCAFCRLPRKVYHKTRLNWMDAAGAACAAILLMWIIWQSLDFRVFLLFVFLLGLADLVITFKRRLALVCPYCGFDPSLYLRSHEKAAEKVKRFIQKKSQDPLNSFFAHPLLIAKKLQGIPLLQAKSARGSRVRVLSTVPPPPDSTLGPI